MLNAFFAQFPARTLPALRISPDGANLNESECVPAFFYTVTENRCQGEILAREFGMIIRLIGNCADVKHSPEDFKVAARNNSRRARES